MLRRLVILLALLLTVPLTALVTTGAADAAAEHKPKPSKATVKDKAGDAPAKVDLLEGRYTWSKKGATFAARVASLSDDTFLAFEVWPLNSGWDRVAVYRENGGTVAKAYFVDNEETPTPYLQKCPGLKAAWNTGTDTVSVTLPRACMTAARSASPGPFEFHTFSRVGGTTDGPTDFLKAVDLYL